VAGSVAVGWSLFFALTAGLIPQDEFESKQYENTMKHWTADFEKAPPQPEFNVQDDEDCIDHVKGYFVRAKAAWKRKDEGAQRLEASYNDILDKQREYKVELVDNKAFIEWIVSDWELTWQSQNTEEKKPEPALDYRIKNALLSSPNGRGR